MFFHKENIPVISLSENLKLLNPVNKDVDINRSAPTNSS